MERELWKTLYLVTRNLDNPRGDWLYSTSDVLGAYYWAVVHDRPTCWAANPKQWPDDLRPRFLPSQSTLSRRLRRARTVALMTAVEEHLLALIVVGTTLVRIIDGKALAVSNVSKDPDTGYGRGPALDAKQLAAVYYRGWTAPQLKEREYKTIAKRFQGVYDSVMIREADEPGWIPSLFSYAGHQGHGLSVSGSPAPQFGPDDK
jgi:hypothetical protein